MGKEDLTSDERRQVRMTILGFIILAAIGIFVAVNWYHPAPDATAACAGKEHGGSKSPCVKCCQSYGASTAHSTEKLMCECLK